MANLAIKGHATRGKEVIEILEMLGGKNVANYDGSNTISFYFLNNIIICSSYGSGKLLGIDCYTLEEFLEKFPYKVGDRVKIPNCDVACRVTNMIWNGIEIEYETTNSEETFFTDELQPYKEETMEETKIDIPEQYPKTYEECCRILDNHPNTDYVEGYKWKLMISFQKLLICRDAYWKIAGKQIGLGKPWEPDWVNAIYTCTIICRSNKIVKDAGFDADNRILAFPTEEMRDAFYENFRELIEECKELL